MNLMPELLNVCKYSGTKFRINTSHLINLRRCFAAEKSTTTPIDRPKVNADGIDSKFQLIYKPPNSDLLKAATSFCALSAAGCPLFLGSYAYDSVYDLNAEFVEQISTLQLSAIGSAGIISLIALYICYKTPLRIYNHQTEYIAILPSVIPTSTRKFDFNKGDIVDKTPSKRAQKFFAAILKPGFGIISFYKVKDRRLLLTIKCFKTPVHFYEMLANTEKYIRKIKKPKI